MQDGEVIKQVSTIMSVRWCAKCKEQYVYFDGWDTLGTRFKRKCCVWNAKKPSKLNRLIERVCKWPFNVESKIGNIEDEPVNYPEDRESLQDQIDRWYRND